MEVPCFPDCMQGNISSRNHLILIFGISYTLTSKFKSCRLFQECFLRSCFFLWKKFLIKQKKPQLFSRDYHIFFISTIPSGGFRLTTSAHCLTNRFVCNFLSSSAGFNLCSCFFPAHPCLLLSLPTFSGPSIPRLITASFPLSDPRCFGILSSASVLDSDY